MSLKEQHLALSSGMGLAGHAINFFWEHGFTDLISIEEIADSVIKPNRSTALHYYLSSLQDVVEEVGIMKDNLGNMEEVFQFIERTLEEVDLKPELPRPEFEKCHDNHGHFECGCSEVVKQWIEYVNKNNEHIDNLIVHSAFQFMFQDRKFLHGFHLDLASLVESEMDYLKEKYPDRVTQKGRIKRPSFPVWLKKAVYYRDKATCVICRCDLSGRDRPHSIIHIDHIVPLKLFGTNDASNMQLLCEPCNTSKGAHSTATSTMNVPCWNLDG